MAEAYRKVEKVIEPIPDNEIRVRRGPRIGKYLHRAYEILSGKISEVSDQTLIIKGVSNAMENAVKLAELIKHRFIGLYQVNSVENLEITDEFEPLEEGLDYLVFKRNSTMLTITLSKNPLDNMHVGYQDPIPDSEVQVYEEREPGTQSEGGRGRGSRRQSFAEGGEGQERSQSRYRSRSRRNRRFTGQRGGRGGAVTAGGQPGATPGGRFEGGGNNRRVFNNEEGVATAGGSRR